MKTESSQQRSSVCARGRNEKRMSWCKMRMFQQDGKTYFEVLWRMSKTKHWRWHRPITNVSPPGCWARTARADACKQGLRKQCWGGRASRPLAFPAGCRQKQRVCVIRGWRWGAVEVKPWEADGCGGVWKRRNLLPLVQSPELLHLREPEVAQVSLSSWGIDLPLTDLTTLIPSESASSTRRGFTSRTVTITFRQAGAELRMLRRFDWICHVLLNMRFLDSVYLIKGNYHSHFTFGDDKAASFRAEGIIEGNVHHGIAI